MLLFFKDFVYIFRERERTGEREGEKHQCVVASLEPPTRDLTCNPGMCPDWESNQQPFGLQAGTQSTELHQPGLGEDYDEAYCVHLFQRQSKLINSQLRTHSFWSKYFW